VRVDGAARLRAARVRAPVIARWLLAAGIGATLFANILAGLSWGPLGAVVAAWPALALVGSYVLLMAPVTARRSYLNSPKDRPQDAGPALPKGADQVQSAAFGVRMLPSVLREPSWLAAVSAHL
jgi:hypothetical protein